MEQSENNPTSELKSVIDEMYEELDMERPPEPDSDTDDENDTGLFIFSNGHPHLFWINHFNY